MSRKHIACAVIAVIAIVGWNAFLIQRDARMFEAYEQTQTTSKR
jgi:hypothetical protein